MYKIVMITLAKIKQIEDRRQKVRKEIYKKIFEQFSRKIQHAVAASQRSVVLQVPLFLIGYPTYNIENAAKYLKRQLLLAGFTLQNIDHMHFCVSWKASRPVRQEDTIEVEGEESLPSLINLKKAANRYRV